MNSAEFLHLIASHLCLDVENPLERIQSTMAETAETYLKKYYADELQDSDAYQLANLMDLMASRMQRIYRNVKLMVDEVDTQYLKTPDDSKQNGIAIRFTEKEFVLLMAYYDKARGSKVAHDILKEYNVNDEARLFAKLQAARNK